MFAGLFIVVAGAEKVLLTTNLTAAVNRLHSKMLGFWLA